MTKNCSAAAARNLHRCHYRLHYHSTMHYLWVEERPDVDVDVDVVVDDAVGDDYCADDDVDFAANRHRPMKVAFEASLPLGAGPTLYALDCVFVVADFLFLFDCLQQQ